MTDSRVFAAANPAEQRDREAPPAKAGNRTLWFSVFGPPAAWSIDALSSLAVHHDYCAALLGHTYRPWNGIGVIFTAIGIAMLAVSLGGGALAWRAHAELGADDGRGETDLDRRRFMARAGLLTCALFSFAIILRLIAPFLLSPDFCGS
jgi:hypothetical protein